MVVQGASKHRLGHMKSAKIGKLVGGPSADSGVDCCPPFGKSRLCCGCLVMAKHDSKVADGLSGFQWFLSDARACMRP